MEVLDRQDMIFASVDSELDAAVDTNQLRDREIERLTEETHEITEDVREDARTKLGILMREHRAKVRDLDRDRQQLRNQLGRAQALVFEQREIQNQLASETARKLEERRQAAADEHATLKARLDASKEEMQMRERQHEDDVRKLKEEVAQVEEQIARINQKSNALLNIEQALLHARERNAAIENVNAETHQRLMRASVYIGELQHELQQSIENKTKAEEALEEIAEKGDDLYCDQREAEDYAGDQRKLVSEMNRLMQSMRFKKTEFARAVKKIPKHEYEAATAELLRAIPGSGHTLPPVAMVRIRTKFPKILERIVRERTQHLVYEYLPLKNEPNKESTYGIDEDLNAVAILPPLPPRELFAQVRDSEE